MGLDDGAVIYTAKFLEDHGMIWGESNVCQRPATRGFTSSNTLPAAFGEVWAALIAIVARSMERPEEAASTSAGGKHSWIKRSMPPLQACTSGQDGRASPEKPNDRPVKSRRYPTAPLMQCTAGKWIYSSSFSYSYFQCNINLLLRFF